jgi:hypothetical protein
VQVRLEEQWSEDILAQERLGHVPSIKSTRG